MTGKNISRKFQIFLQIFGLVAGFLYTGTAAATPAMPAQSEIKELALELVWSMDGGPYGSSRSLEPTMTITSEYVLVDANITKGDRRHEVIRAFEIKTGQPGPVIEHPDGEPFEGLGDAIAANDQFIVTALHRGARFGQGGELLVYDAKTLKLLRRIKNPRSTDTAFFGLTDVVLVGDRILAATTLAAGNISTAWVFSAKTGEVLLTINAPKEPQAVPGKPRANFFGRSMAMNATHIAIGANDLNGPSGLNARGIVYIFDAKNGALLHRLKTPGSDQSSGFGNSLTISNERLYVSDLEESGALNWPTGKMYAFNLATGENEFSIADSGVPKRMEDFSAGNEGWGFPTNMSVDGSLLFSGLPDWSEKGKRQGGLIIFDARTGEELLKYTHKSGEEWGAFGKAITAKYGYVAVMQNISDGGPGAVRVMLYRVKTL